MAVTQQLGTTRLFPFPKCPCCQRTNCLYAAWRKFSLLRPLSSTKKSSLYRIAISKTLPFKTSCANKRVVVIHARLDLVQHLFSSCVGIIMQCPHMHHSGRSPLGGGFGGSNPSPPGISPFTISAKAAGCRLNNSRANLLNCSTFKPSTRF